MQSPFVFIQSVEYNFQGHTFPFNSVLYIFFWFYFLVELYYMLFIHSREAWGEKYVWNIYFCVVFSLNVFVLLIRDACIFLVIALHTVCTLCVMFIEVLSFVFAFLCFSIERVAKEYGKRCFILKVVI